ncbi:MAG: hypothetical protein WCK78_07115 [Paludibacter sp.]
MNKRLKGEELYDSFDSVKQFLMDGKYLVNGGNVSCYFIEGSNQIKLEVFIELKSHIPSYNLTNDVFLSYGLYNPIWSAYKLLKWDDETKELIIDVSNRKTKRLKRIN